MTQSSTGAPENMKEAKALRRDWIVLPMLGLLTIALTLASTEAIARGMFFQTKTTAESCMVLNDPSTGTRGIPGCVCWEKMGENQPVEYRFNSSGYRAEAEFGPKPPGRYRIVIVGSSFAMGMRVPMEEALSTRLPAELSDRTGRRVEIFNEGMAGNGGSPRSVALRFNDALTAKPDMILWILTPWDIHYVSRIMPEDDMPAGNRVFWGRTRRLVKESLTRKSIPEVLHGLSEAVADPLIADRTRLMLQHFLYESQSLCVKSYLRGGDEEAGFLRAEPSAEWQGRLGQFGNYAAELERRARAAGIPLVAVFLPERAQAAMISMGEWPPGYDPYKLDDELRSIITSYGGTYIDILPEFRGIPNPEQGYFPVDGHLNAGGHAVISRLLARKLTGGAIPALIILAQQPAAVEQRR